MIHPDIPYLLEPAHSILPPLLLPLCSSSQENITEEEMDTLPEECQYLTDQHVQEIDVEIVKIHLETLWLLATRGGVAGKRIVKEKGTYIVVRELHLSMEDEGVRRGCERIVDTIMGDEIDGLGVTGTSGQGKIVGEQEDESGGRMVTQEEPDGEEDDSEDDKIVPIF